MSGQRPSNQENDLIAFRGRDPVLAGAAPGVREALETGVPRRCVVRRYVASDSLETISIPTAGRLIAFGTSGLTDRICVDPRNGHVLEITGPSLPTFVFVNSSLPQFTETVRAVMAAFPFHGIEATEAEVDDVADRLAGTIETIDGPSIGSGTFWSIFVDDLRMGDYATEIVVGRS